MNQIKALAAQAQAVAQQAEILAMQAAALARQAETMLAETMDRGTDARSGERPYGEAAERAGATVFRGYNRHHVGDAEGIEADSRSGGEPATTHKE